MELGETRIQSLRVRGLLVVVILVAGGVAVAEVGLWVFDPEAGYLVLGAATGLFALALVWPLLDAQLRPGRAIVTTFLAILAIQATYVLVFPQAAVALALASVVVAALALTYSSRDVIFWLMAASALVAVGVVAAGQFLEPRFEPNPVGAGVIVVSTAAAAVLVTFTLLWQFGTRLNETLARTRAANEALEAASAARIRFVNTAAHELRTPLLPLQMQVRMLKTTRSAGLSGDQQRGIDIMDRNLGRLSVLVEDLLESARAQAGRQNVSLAPVDVAKLARETVDEYAQAAKDRNLALSTGASGETVAELDARKIRQVISNLVGNAVKFTRPGGRIAVTVTGQESGVEVVVTDTGTGISADGLGKLFEPFSQVHDPLQISEPGSGLGLYIAKSFVELHLGSIRASSPGLGKGTTITVFLPRKQVPDGATGPSS